MTRMEGGEGAAEVGPRCQFFVLVWQVANSGKTSKPKKSAVRALLAKVFFCASLFSPAALIPSQRLCSAHRDDDDKPFRGGQHVGPTGDLAEEELERVEPGQQREGKAG